jgi:hypothetical protein
MIVQSNRDREKNKRAGAKQITESRRPVPCQGVTPLSCGKGWFYLSAMKIDEKYNNNKRKGYLLWRL